MILYFSGTGNSRLVAEKLAGLTKDQIHNLEQGAPPKMQDGETLILVAPLYFWALPSLVLSFLKKHQELNRKELHVVMTCGGALGAGASFITRQLRGLGFQEVYVHALIMTTNYIPLHRVQRKEVAEKAVQAALNRLPEIAEDIRQKRGAPTSSFLAKALPIYQGMYDRARQTRRFYATNKCVGCGKCERDCPSQAIHLINGYPRWDKPQCALCLRCLHRCPQAAIEHGKGTVGKERYHPEKFLLENARIKSSQKGI
ncbi:MAG: EFR1 family ferrodoxin [Bacillota bacterium]|nr:EFR1 family ferrodoxin [Bacillota bacterium]